MISFQFVTLAAMSCVLLMFFGMGQHAAAFSAPVRPFTHVAARSQPVVVTLAASDGESPTSDDGVVELVDEEEETQQESSAAAPFLSQGDISKEALNPDLSDPKQTRVIIYIIISLIPVLFLIPLMLGSRDLIPLDAIPPVTL